MPLLRSSVVELKNQDECHSVSRLRRLMSVAAMFGILIADDFTRARTRNRINPAARAQQKQLISDNVQSSDGMQT